MQSRIPTPHRPGPACPALSGLIGFLGLLAVSSAVHAQAIPADDYLRFVPLTYPRIVGATEANVELGLWGDPAAPGYRDVDPVDGIDDRRHDRLMRLAVKFSPILIRNTDVIPTAFESYLEREEGFHLHVDTWTLGGREPRRVATRSIDVGPGRDSAADRGLLELIRQFHPLSPGPAYGDVVLQPEMRQFRVLYFDFPGGGPGSWKREYRRHRERAEASGLDIVRTYMHPFLRDARDVGPGVGRYELVLQYWFFYPFNDGGNDHEGDWQPLNVVVGFRDDPDGRLDASQVERLLGSDAEFEAALERLVIARVEYLFHHNLLAVDYLSPNVYRPREEWRREIREREYERLGSVWLWERIREMAYVDAGESAVNTHPIAYIGGDHKGLEQLLSAPGGADRDSHVLYPMPGLYKNVGPGGAAEQINAGLNYHYAVHDTAEPIDDRVVRFDDPARIRILPDWERLLPRIDDDPEVRRRWGWFVLPVRWGYPAARSPFAGVIPHAETGNLSPLGPSFGAMWNRAGPGIQARPYDPHKLAGTFPLGWQDGFMNRWGYLNLTLPTLAILPPFDFAWRILLAPVRAPFRSNRPTYFPEERPPMRFVSLTGGVSASFMPDNFTLLFTDPMVFEQIEPLLREDGNGPAVVGENATTSWGPAFGMEFHIGRFVSENTLRRVRGRIGFEVVEPAERPGNVPVRADLVLWEYSGSLRYNLRRGLFLPHLKAGYGLSWYRLEDIRVDGDALDPDRTDWVRRPSLFPPRNVLPNTWHLGLGIEARPIRNLGGPPRGLDLSVKASYSLHLHGLGLGRRAELGEQEDFTLARPQLDLELAVGF